MPEAALVAILLALAGSLAAVAARPGLAAWRDRPALLPLAAALASSLVLAAAATHRMPARPPQPAPAPLQAAAPGDTTSAACRACHPDQHATWHDSYHRTMTQTVSADSVLGDFDDARVEFGGTHYHLFERDGEFFAESTTARPGDGVERSATVRLYQTTGSHHMQIYWFASGADRMMEAFPLVWLREQRRWIPRLAAFVTPPSDLPEQASVWNYTCIGCHTTRPRPRVALGATAHADSHITELGIACEACHGAGEQHVEANRSPLHRYQQHASTEPDATITNPSRLSHVRSAQVCGQCHGVKTFYSEAQAVAWAQHGWTYRPGDDLDAAVNVISKATLARPYTQMIMRAFPDFVSGSFWDDGIVRVTGREYNALLESGCFQRGELDCTSCHTLHQAPDDPRERADWANDQLTPGMDGDLACTQCHERFAEAPVAAQHSQHQPGSTGNACQNCHMPFATYGLLKAIRSHEIGSPRVVTVGPGSARPNACNLCHLDRPLGWSAEHLVRWYGQDLPPLSEDDERVAAGVRWAIAGDAGVRALIAWSMGWTPAQQASGSRWMVPYLMRLMEDPYDAVRIIATRSLATVPGFERAEFDALAPPERRAEAARALRAQSASLSPSEEGRADATLSNLDAALLASELARLLQQRDDRPLNLAE